MLSSPLPIHVTILKKCYLLEKSLQISSKTFPIESPIRGYPRDLGPFDRERVRALADDASGEGLLYPSGLWYRDTIPSESDKCVELRNA
ncbi:hypothetical protein MMC31_005406, partial [Peltigera leucophlebia]|nr:hypothetical protein [Peltigera leucophlebia]